MRIFLVLPILTAASGLASINEHVLGTNFMSRSHIIKPKLSEHVCEKGEVKTYLKLTQEEQDSGAWGEKEKELLKNTISYAVEANDPSVENFGVTWGSETNRISFCMTLTKDGCDQPGSDCQIEEAQDIIRTSVYYNKTLVYGTFEALGWDESILVFEGVPKTYELDSSSGLDPWYIPFFVVLGLVLVGVCVGLYFSLRGSEDDTKSESDENSLSNDQQGEKYANDVELQATPNEKDENPLPSEEGTQNYAYEEEDL